jgi:uncharacterized repeat protein (TIGR03803 family)
MGSHPLKQTLKTLLLAGILASGGLLNAVGAAADLTTLVSFAGLNGAKPYSALLLATDGSLYGTTYEGGTNGLPFGLGTVFKLSPTGSLTTLFSFSNSNGARPYAALTQGADGDLYGTTFQGGSSNLGTVFRVTTNGALTSLLSFTNGNGAKPSGRLILGRDGFFYGTTQFGGASNHGTVFRVTTNGALTTLVSFYQTNGANPNAEVIQGLDGHFYGTTVNGGLVDAGTIFRVATNGTLTTLFSFNGSDGSDPYGGLVQDANGILYGNTAYGGTNGYGIVFRITTNGTLTTLHTFSGDYDGANPWSSLIRGKDNTLYGTTILGGTTTSAGAWGTVFQITTNGTFASLVSLDFDTNGVSPYASLVQDSAGNLYGTTYSGGFGLKGTVFRLTPAPTTLQASLQPGNTFRVTWDAWLGKQYQVQYQTNASQGGWIDFGNSFIATNSPLTVDSSATGPARLYRVRLMPAP